MTLKDFASKLAAENSFIKASFGGFAGAGKTRTASELIIGFYKKTGLKKPLLIIDNEKGSRFLVPMFNAAGIETYAKETTTLADVLEAFKMVQSGEIGFLFIDSLTKVWYQYVRDYKNANRRTFMTLQDWGKILPAWQESFADVFVNTTGNIVFTGRGGYTYDMEENEETKKKEFVKSGVKMKMAGETPFEPDLNIWMDIQQEMSAEGRPIIWREALVMKDRSGLIDGKTFKNPTFKDFEPVIDYLLNVQKGDVAKASNTANLAPSENYEQQNRRDQRDIELEKIKAVMIKNNIGSASKEDKQLMIAIIERFFGTISWQEVEKMQLERLIFGRTQLELMFESWDMLTDFQGRIAFVKDFKFSSEV
ncbi:MAG TPA: AAA family ATPase [Lentimicrobium sp.]|nr:AAA family ATPase [Lentimicrobium sp.]